MTIAQADIIGHIDGSVHTFPYGEFQFAGCHGESKMTEIHGYADGFHERGFACHICAGQEDHIPVGIQLYIIADCTCNGRVGQVLCLECIGILWQRIGITESTLLSYFSNRDIQVGFMNELQDGFHLPEVFRFQQVLIRSNGADRYGSIDIHPAQFLHPFLIHDL